ncbi:class A beta-lactamase [Bosea vestrisii]|uniref:class A beta-lactamase n=1 Tax=Bosea vestrisii TaxID=151416 RepID=UPI0024DFB473|nr:class A beta-lactamase [Bosea vestrisii]WID99095.1 class A beta-lactamase [Bosea vestrisii]
MIRRRDLLVASLMSAPMLGGLPALAQGREDEVREALFALDRKHGGRLGVAILDSGNGRVIAHRGEERFAMCSTFKFVAAAFVLARVDRGEEELDRRVSYTKADLVTYSPVTEKHVEKGLTVAELCDAAVTLSDNAAGNLLLDSFGGPKGLTSYMRSLGDDSSRLDRRELELNEATPGDPRDTTTPVAMAQILRQTVLGAALSPASRHQLTAWLVANKTGDKRLRAGVPKGWRVGDRTGTGSNNATNDIGVIWPPGRAPRIITAYYAESRGTFPEREAVLAEVGRLATSL